MSIPYHEYYIWKDDPYYYALINQDDMGVCTWVLYRTSNILVSTGYVCDSCSSFKTIKGAKISLSKVYGKGMIEVGDKIEDVINYWKHNINYNHQGGK